MNVLITGTNGFIGSHLKELAANIGCNVISISRKLEKPRINSYTYEDFLSRRLDLKIDCVLHLASPNYDYANDSSLQEGITNLTDKILSVLPYYNCKKFIYFSSAKVYGEPSLEEGIFFEDSKLNPLTDYGKEKVNAENLVLMSSKNYDLDFIIYRMPLVYGPSMNSNIGNLFKLLNNAIPFVSFKNTSHLRKSFLSIENIKTCIKFNLQNMDTINRNIFNISDNNDLAFDEFIYNYKNISKSKSMIINFPGIFFKILIKLPILNKMLIKLYGNFHITNIKVQDAFNIKLKDTQEGLSYLLSKKL